MEVSRHQHILVGIETDPTRYHGENAGRPALLDKEAAEQVLAGIAADLKAVLPGFGHCALSMAGALFDQAQVLRPQMPLYGALEILQQSTGRDGGFRPRLLGIGASNGRMPLEELQPFEEITPGVLQILPILVSAPAREMDKLAVEMEHRFPEQGQLSSDSVKDVETHFQISVNQARFMTVSSLGALLRRQLEHYGFLPLWELLEAALTQATAELEVCTAAGARFKWHEGAVHSFFETFDWWANYGAGTDSPAADQQLQSAYADWTREYRRYQRVLDAHGVRVCRHLAGLEDAELKDSFLLEESTLAPPPAAAPVTEHDADGLGTVAVTVVSRERQMNFYPLLASGLNDLHRFIRDNGLSGDVAYPGRIHYDESFRQLTSEPLPC
jgi:hypothetical protein